LQFRYNTKDEIYLFVYLRGWLVVMPESCVLFERKWQFSATVPSAV
jgi:hypothetical protein